jgi:DNA-directed RNA polymerase specialized sigma24 family protein
MEQEQRLRHPAAPNPTEADDAGQGLRPWCSRWRNRVAGSYREAVDLAQGAFVRVHEATRRGVEGCDGSGAEQQEGHEDDHS